MSTPTRLIAFALAASLASTSPHGAPRAAQEPDLSGRWLQVPPIVDEMPRAVEVTRRIDTRENRDGQTFSRTHLRIAREGGRGAALEDFVVGLVGGTTGGIQAMAKAPEWSTSFANGWRGEALVMERRASRGQTPDEAWTEATERWTVEADGTLQIQRTERASDAAPGAWVARYGRDQAMQVPAADRLAPVRPLLGDWDGTAEGQPGKGTVRRSYTLVLGDRFVHERNVTTYPAQAANPKGEVHEHWSLLDFDRQRDTIVLRQFHQEGFVNEYRLDPSASTPARLVFESVRFDNLDPAWRARETYELQGPDAFTETFELAQPGKPFAVYSRSRFTRRK